jgi:hypothetical protein
MATLTIPRPDVSAEQIGEVLRQRLGSRYTVRPGQGMTTLIGGGRGSGNPDRIAVGVGSAQLFCAEVTMTRHGGHISVRVIPGGIGPLLRITNELWLARKVRRALRAEPSLR